MTIEKLVNGNQIIFKIVGQIDTSTAPEFERAVLGESIDSDIVCDFTGVNYISSAGLRVILAIHKSQTEKGKKAIYTGVCEDVMSIFTMTGFTSFLQFK